MRWVRESPAHFLALLSPELLAPRELEFARLACREIAQANFTGGFIAAEGAAPTSA